MSPSITVVIPYYNRSDFIDETVNSVLRQTMPPDEIILVDDGSRSDQAAHLDRYGKRVRVIHQENRGLPAARNTGVAAASCEWIAFLDDDDLWLPNRLEILTAYMREHPDCHAIHNAVQLLGSDTIYRKSPLRLRDFLFTHPNPASPSSVLVRRDKLLLCGSMNPLVKMNEDHGCFLRVALFDDFHYIDLPLVLRRMHASNLSYNYREEFAAQNRLLAAYGYLYAIEAEKIRYAVDLNAEFLSRAFYARDWRTAGDILFRYCRMHGASSFRTALKSMALLVANRAGKSRP